MNEYISRYELRKHLADCMTAELFDSDMKKAVVGIDIYVENMPSADVQPVKRGKWILKENAILTSECSLCKRSVSMLEAKFYKFCPYCGARMEGVKNE